MPLSTKHTNFYVVMCSGLPLAKYCQWQATATAQTLAAFVATIRILLIIVRFCCHLQNLLPIAKKQCKFCFHTPLSLAYHTPQITPCQIIILLPPPPPTLLPTPPKALPPTKRRTSVVTRMPWRMTPKTRHQMMMKGQRARSFAQQGTSSFRMPP
jgi:hypothetical protein